MNPVDVTALVIDLLNECQYDYKQIAEALNIPEDAVQIILEAEFARDDDNFFPENCPDNYMDDADAYASAFGEDSY